MLNAAETVLLIGVVALGLVGLLAILNGTQQYYSQWQAVRRAETASGTIKSVDIQTVYGSNTSKGYLPYIEYEYQTPTQRLHGTRLYPGTHSNSLFGTPSAASHAVENYEPGESTTVYYDPQNPKHAFLDPTVQSGSSLGIIGFGLLLVVIAVAVLVSIGDVAVL